MEEKRFRALAQLTYLLPFDLISKINVSKGG